MFPPAWYLRPSGNGWVAKRKHHCTTLPSRRPAPQNLDLRGGRVKDGPIGPLDCRLHAGQASASFPTVLVPGCATVSRTRKDCHRPWSAKPARREVGRGEVLHAIDAALLAINGDRPRRQLASIPLKLITSATHQGKAYTLAGAADRRTGGNLWRFPRALAAECCYAARSLYRSEGASRGPGLFDFQCSPKLFMRTGLFKRRFPGKSNKINVEQRPSTPLILVQIQVP